MSDANSIESQPLVWSNRFATLGEDFLTHLQPTPLPETYWIHKNHQLLKTLGWPTEGLSSPDALLAFSGCAIPEGAKPFASWKRGFNENFYGLLGNMRQRSAR